LWANLGRRRRRYRPAKRKRQSWPVAGDQAAGANRHGVWFRREQ